MDKLLANAQCKLGNQTLNLYYENTYGILCNKDYNEWLPLFLWAYESGCLDKPEDCNHCQNDCIHCNLQTNIGKTIKYCKDCKPKKYKKPIIVKNDDYTEWYNSPEYISCLQIELEENGYIEPMVDLCKNLNIDITSADACTVLATNLAAQQIDCFVLTDIHVAEACSNILTTLTAETTCKTIEVEIQSDGLCKTFTTNIE